MITGLFLERLFKIWIVLRISSSLPNTGSSLLFLASSVKSVVYFFKASFSFSVFSVVFSVLGEEFSSTVSSKFTILLTSSVIFS